jgi:redox-sensitive bicupin YhaK (pirin superfamily)
MNHEIKRRGFIGSVSALFAAWFFPGLRAEDIQVEPVIKSVKPLGFQWETADPFLFCAHHEDYFPVGNGAMGPKSDLLLGRHLGDDFIIKDGFRMYHGKTVPGFPGHPHRGFETITIVKKGLVDHADSMGAAGRYGNGDVQWMTAGKGVQHAEMFPLLRDDQENPLELFQIWLNLPAKNKMVSPHFKMFWKEEIPSLSFSDHNKKLTHVELVAGKLNDAKALTAPPDSWAFSDQNDVWIWNISMEVGAEWTLPASGPHVIRNLYFHEGENLKIEQQLIPPYHKIELDASKSVPLKNEGSKRIEILLLQGKPIQEQVMQYGPFVMNTKEEIKQAFEDYHATQFGGWPWPSYDHVHSKEKGRFAKHADGREELKS